MSSEKTNRNDPCPCGSGKKYKKCCALKTGMQKYKTEVVQQTDQGLAGRISQFGRAMKERETEIKKKVTPDEQKDAES